MEPLRRAFSQQNASYPLIEPLIEGRYRQMNDARDGFLSPQEILHAKLKEKNLKWVQIMEAVKHDPDKPDTVRPYTFEKYVRKGRRQTILVQDFEYFCELIEGMTMPRLRLDEIPAGEEKTRRETLCCLIRQRAGGSISLYKNHVALDENRPEGLNANYIIENYMRAPHYKTIPHEHYEYLRRLLKDERFEHTGHTRRTVVHATDIVKSARLFVRNKARRPDVNNLDDYIAGYQAGSLTQIFAQKGGVEGWRAHLPGPLIDIEKPETLNEFLALAGVFQPLEG